MGSLGTVAQAEQSDMDLWVCHDPELDPRALAELRRKCDLLEAWAATQGAEVHCFLIDPARYTQGDREAQLTSDDCGTTQHYLLLDEFYRTAIWLGAAVVAGAGVRGGQLPRLHPRPAEQALRPR